MGVQFWQEFSNSVIRLTCIYQWSMKKCEETNFPVYACWHTGGGTATTSLAYFFGAAWTHIPMQHTIVVNVAKY